MAFLASARLGATLVLSGLALPGLVAACSSTVIVAAGPDPVDAQAPPATEEPSPPPAPDEDAAPAPDAAPSLPCLEDLKARGLTHARTTARGVVDAVTVSSPINGVVFTTDNTDKPTTQPMACEFVRTLWSFAEVLKSRGIRRVGTLGAYCYRCCCAWSETNKCRTATDPEPQCGSNGYSNHSFGRALDVRWLYLDSGAVYDINKDTDFKATAGGTCKAATLAAQTGASKFLYELVCEVAEKKIFATVLTPNYNSAHRNHWHMDTGERGIPKNTQVLSIPAGVDEGYHPDSCGE